MNETVSRLLDAYLSPYDLTRGRITWRSKN